MEEVQINLNDVIESLSNQVKQLSTSIAYNEAIIKAKDEEIERLSKEVEEYRKKEIEEMNNADNKWFYQFNPRSTVG